MGSELLMANGRQTSCFGCHCFSWRKHWRLKEYDRTFFLEDGYFLLSVLFVDKRGVALVKMICVHAPKYGISHHNMPHPNFISVTSV